MKSSVTIYSNITGDQFIITFVLLSKRQPFLFTHPSHHIYNYPLSVLGPVSNQQYPQRHAHITCVSSQSFRVQNDCGHLFSHHVLAGRILIIDGQIIEILQESRQVNSPNWRQRKVCVCARVSEKYVHTTIWEWKEEMDLQCVQKKLHKRMHTICHFLCIKNSIHSLHLKKSPMTLQLKR